MPKSSVNASLSSYDDIFSTEESRQEEQREQVQQIPIGELFPYGFPDSLSARADSRCKRKKNPDRHGISLPQGK